MNFKLLTHKSASSSLRTYSPRFFNTSLRNNIKEQYFRANNVSFRFSSTIHHQFCNKSPFTAYLPHRNIPRSPFHPFFFLPINFTRSISSFPPSKFYSSPQKTFKQIIALGGAVVTFFILKPTLLLIINGAVAFGTYKLLKRLLDHLFPTIESSQFPTAQLTKTQRTLLVDKLYSKSIEQIKRANLNYNILEFSDPHSISSKSVGFSSIDSRGQNHQQQNTIINIEYWAIGGLNNKKALVKVEGVFHNHDDIIMKNIEMYWPNTGKIVNVPEDLKQGWQNYQKPPIIEAEFRDID